MPHKSSHAGTKPPAGHLPDRTMQFYHLIQAQATGHVTRAERDQYMDFYLGLNMLNGHTTMLTRRLWREVRLPLGYILRNGWYKHISTIAQYGKRNPNAVITLLEAKARAQEKR